MRKLIGAGRFSVAAFAAVVVTAALGMSPPIASVLADPPNNNNMGVGGGNTPPDIRNFIAVQNEGGSWTFSGYVTDNEDPRGWIVFITGNNFTTFAVVDADGYFSVTETLGPGNSGTVSATVTDTGNLSDTEYTYID